MELVQCLTQDVQVPADADIIIEGYIDPEEEYILEGPFGDHTGYYSLADFYPRFHITCITHQRDAFIRQRLSVFRHRKMPGLAKRLSGFF